MIFHQFAVFDARSCVFLVGHVVEIGLHHPGDAVMGYQQIGLAGVGLQLVQQVVDALGQLHHALAAVVAVGEVGLGNAELAAVAESKRFIRNNLQNMPSILDLCKRDAMNKNKLQKAFQLTEGKSIGEYVRTLRMEQALELLEQSDMTVQEIAATVGYHGVSNFYHAFQQKFGSTPQAVRDMLKK